MGLSPPHYNGHPDGECLKEGCDDSAVPGGSYCYSHGSRP